MKILTDKQFKEEVYKAISEHERNERVELKIRALDDRIDNVMRMVEELRYALRERKEE